jgi:hypothetical protein
MEIQKVRSDSEQRASSRSGQRPPRLGPETLGCMTSDFACINVSPARTHARPSLPVNKIYRNTLNFLIF